MNSETSLFLIRDNNVKDLDNSSIEFPTLDDLMAEQNIKSKEAKTVHHRRDLDSLG